MIKLADIHHLYDTDKGTSHSYVPTYDQLLAPLQYGTFNFLEIGVLTCGSLKMFNTFFPNATIFGMDNWIQSTDHHSIDLSSIGVDLEKIKQDTVTNYSRIKLLTCDSTNKDNIFDNLINLRFKIILDDGDHNPQAQLKTFVNLFEYLEEDGIYIIEDVFSIHWLKDQVDKYLRVNNSPLRSQAFEFYKDGRADDAVLVISGRII